MNVIGLDSEKTAKLRTELRKKKIHLHVVKSSLARLATKGTPLEAAFSVGEGSMAIAWGSDDVVSLAKRGSMKFIDMKDFGKLGTSRRRCRWRRRWGQTALKWSARGQVAAKCCPRLLARFLALDRTVAVSLSASAVRLLARSSKNSKMRKKAEGEAPAA